MDLLSQYKQAYDIFTYHLEGEPIEQKVLQVGIVAFFHLSDGATIEGRKRIAAVLSLLDNQFGSHLNYGYFNPNTIRRYKTKTLQQKQQEILSHDGNDLDFVWMSGRSLDHVSDYQIGVNSAAQWFEMIHKTITTVHVYFPLTELHNTNFNLNSFLSECCNVLQPMHGICGLGLQQCFEHHRYQHLEYEIAQRFNGLHIINSKTHESYRDGIGSVNWYTFVSNQWLEKLGGELGLRSVLNDERITLLPYSSGIIVKAGELPELGWTKEDPYPELYVKVNNALKPIRAPQIGSLGYGSIAGEIRFNERTTAEWLARFDNVPLQSEKMDPPTIARNELTENRVFITRESGEIAPHSGLWTTLQHGTSESLEIKENTVLPYWQSKRDDNIYKTTWTLIRRDDGGDCTVPNDLA